MSHPSLLTLIRPLWEAGLTPVPRLGASPATVYLQSTGEVTSIQWSLCKRHQPDWPTVETWFTTGDLDTLGIQLLCGTPAYPKDTTEPLLQILDIEHAATFEQWCEELNFAGHADLLYRCTIERTPSGGVHIGFRCATISEKDKVPLAKRAHPTKPMLIELLQHHCCTVAPTRVQCKPEHPVGVAYHVTQGSWCHVQTLSQDQRQVLIDAARAFNEMPEHVARDRSETRQGPGDRPGDKLNALADRDWWLALLTKHGWRDVTRPSARRQGITTFQRPGKYGRQGSATYGVCGPYFYVFSSNAYPFEPDIPYSPFVAYTLLEHGGDFRQASVALMKQYGWKVPAREMPPPTALPVRSQLSTRVTTRLATTLRSTL